MPINSSNSVHSRPLALVTGASSGIGYEVARELTQKGFDLIVVSDEAAITETAAKLGSQNADVRPVRVDLTDETQIDRLYAMIASDARPLAAAVFNAGTGTAGDFAREVPIEQSMNVVKLNVVGTVYLAKFVLNDMAAAGTGKVMFTSSIEALAPSANQATYAASKAFMNSFADALRVELSDTAVTITTLMPGLTDTKFFERSRILDTFIGATRFKDDPADVARAAVEAMLAGKPRAIPLWKNKVFAAMASSSPKALVSRLYKVSSKRGSAQVLKRD